MLLELRNGGSPIIESRRPRYHSKIQIVALEIAEDSDEDYGSIGMPFIRTKAISRSSAVMEPGTVALTGNRIRNFSFLRRRAPYLFDDHQDQSEEKQDLKRSFAKIVSLPTQASASVSDDELER